MNDSKNKCKSGGEKEVKIGKKVEELRENEWKEVEEKETEQGREEGEEENRKERLIELE